jgi:hypothetical protein
MENAKQASLCVHYASFSFTNKYYADIVHDRLLTVTRINFGTALYILSMEMQIMTSRKLTSRESDLAVSCSHLQRSCRP